MTLVHISRTPMEEISRTHDGQRWCFQCRKPRAFEHVVMRTVEPSYYEPSHMIKCASCGLTDGDLFPGRERIWE